MENIYFFWWLKYTIDSPEGDHISDVIEDIKKDIPDMEKKVYYKPAEVL